MHRCKLQCENCVRLYKVFYTSRYSNASGLIAKERATEAANVLHTIVPLAFLKAWYTVSV